MIPSDYADRRKLSPAAERAFAGALDVWADLSPPMQSKLIDCWPEGKRSLRTYLPKPTLDALYERGICDAQGCELEPLGALARQVGTRTRSTR